MIGLYDDKVEKVLGVAIDASGSNAEVSVAMLVIVSRLVAGLVKCVSCQPAVAHSMTCILTRGDLGLVARRNHFEQVFEPEKRLEHGAKCQEENAGNHEHSPPPCSLGPGRDFDDALSTSSSPDFACQFTAWTLELVSVGTKITEWRDLAGWTWLELVISGQVYPWQWVTGIRLPVSPRGRIRTLVTGLCSRGCILRAGIAYMISYTVLQPGHYEGARNQQRLNKNTPFLHVHSEISEHGNTTWVPLLYVYKNKIQLASTTDHSQALLDYLATF